MASRSNDPAAVYAKFWDALAHAHGRGSDAYYDIEALVSGRSTLSDVEDAALRESVGDVNGLDVLHVQCHLGLDAVSMARRGARVTGVDFSPVALRRAAEIATACGVQVDYVEGDSTAIPAFIAGALRLGVRYDRGAVLDRRPRRLDALGSIDYAPRRKAGAGRAAPDAGDGGVERPASLRHAVRLRRPTRIR